MDFNGNGENPDSPTSTEQTPSNKGITIRVPASAANLGPGFETLALALKLYSRITVRVQAPRKGQQGPEIIAVGPIAKQLPTDHTNLIAKVMEQVWPQDPRLLSCLKITIDTDIPFSCGLGASAAATTAGVTAAMALGGIQLEKGLIFSETAKMEGHADSAGACLFGGLMICAPNIIAGDILPRKLSWPENWRIIATIPPYTIPSKKARATLPASVSLKDAVFNVQRIALFIEAVAAIDAESMKAALKDKLHEPYRAKLVPELAEIRKLLQDLDVLGTVLSGSGPTVITFVEQQYEDELIQRLQSWSQSRKAPCQIMQLEVDDDGIQITD